MLSPNRLGGQTLMAFALKIWNAGASFALSWLIARHFGAAGSGHFGIAVTTVTVLSYVALAGLDYTVVRTAAGDLREGKRAEARGTIVAAGRAVLIGTPLLIGVLWLAREALAVDVLRQPDMGPLLAIMLWSVLPVALQRVASASLRVAGRTAVSQVVDGPLGTTAAALGLALVMFGGAGSDLVLPGWIYLGGVTIGALAGWVMLVRTLKAWPAAVAVPVLPLLVAGLPVVGSNLSNVFTEWYTTVSLGVYWPAATVGQYRVAWQFVALAGLVQTALDTMIGPRIAAAARVGAFDEVASVARKSVVLVLLMAAPLFAALMIFPERLLALFGPEFVGGALVLQILAAGQLFRLASGPLGSILVMSGNQRWVLVYAGVSVVLCLTFVAVLVPVYGAVGAAIATGATVVLRNIVAGIILQYVVGISLFRSRKES